MAPFVNSSLTHWVPTIPIAVLGASLLGSAHCTAMCGGLVLTVARDRKALIRYHLGRLLGYCGLGAIAGFLGETVLQSQTYTFIPWISTSILALGFIFLGIRLWLGKSLHLFSLPRNVWRRLAGFGAGTTGLLSAFLPCGWLHAFILGAVATQNSLQGALYLFFFWLGTLPAVSLAPLTVTKIFRPIAQRAPRLSAVILVVIGLSTLGMKMLPPHDSSHCHGSRSNSTTHSHH